jgi:hypothetical protein
VLISCFGLPNSKKALAQTTYWTTSGQAIHFSTERKSESLRFALATERTEKRAPTLANEPIEAADAIDAMEPKEPMEPIENELPIEPMENELPIEPMDQNDPMEPMERALPSDPTECTELELDELSSSSDCCSLTGGSLFNLSVVAPLRRLMKRVAPTTSSANSTTAVRAKVPHRGFIVTSLRSDFRIRGEHRILFSASARLTMPWLPRRC